MSEEELGKNDILFQIDMQLYDEFNDKLCEMNEHWGDIYSLSEIEEVEQAEKEKERKLLREAISKLQKENVELKEEIEHKQETIDKIMKELEEFYKKYDIISKDKIRAEIKELEEMEVYGVLFETGVNFAIRVLKELLGE